MVGHCGIVGQANVGHAGIEGQDILGHAEFTGQSGTGGHGGFTGQVGQTVWIEGHGEYTGQMEFVGHGGMGGHVGHVGQTPNWDAFAFKYCLSRCQFPCSLSYVVSCVFPGKYPS